MPLGGSTITAKLRRQIDDAVVATWSTSIVDGPDGMGQIVLSAATTGALEYEDSPPNEWNPTQFVYDILILLAGGDTIGPIRGFIQASKAASR